MIRNRLVLLGGMLLGGCFGRSAPVEFYMLEPERRAVSGEAVAKQSPGLPLIAVGPIRIPEYLDRPQIVTAQGRNTYRLDEQHRWAERLDDNLSRVLVKNLETLVPARQVLANTSDRGQPADFRVAVDILEFHMESDGQALLSAQWRIRKGSQTLSSQTSTLRVAAVAGDYESQVAALNQCVNRLSRIIARTILQLPKAVDQH